MGVPLFPFDDSIRQLYQDGIDTIIFYLGRPCLFLIPGEPTPCPNCRFDAAAGASSGAYNGTGSHPFSRPPCPVCRGTGLDPAISERIETGTLSIDRDLRPDKVLPPGVLTVPATIARVKGIVDVLPLVQASRHIILDYQNARYSQEKYVLLEGTSPQLTGSIVAGRYFTAFLKKVA